MQNLLAHLLRFFSFLAVIGVVALAIGIYSYSFMEIFKVLKMIFYERSEEGEIILKALKAIDAVLIGVVFFIIGLGLFELFISPIDNLPKWLKIEDIDQLKSKLIKVIVLVMGVSFGGRVVTWDGSTEMLYIGVGLGAVVIALSYFLKVKNKDIKST